MAVGAWMFAAGALATPPAEAPWHEHYRRGLELIAEGRGAAAQDELLAAHRARPEEGLRVHTEGPHYVDYLPHVHLAIASHMAGDPSAARRYLEAAERSGVAAGSDSGRQLLQAYRIILGTAAGEAGSFLPRSGAEGGAPGAPPTFRDYPLRPPMLAEEDFRSIRTDVLSRCRLRVDTAPKTAPWYFHWELGLELTRRGDHQRALDAFVEATSRRTQPQHTARLYGMWFTDYVPYFRIARAHALLGNWECARDALRVSEQTHEITPRDPEFEELRALVLEVSKKAR